VSKDLNKLRSTAADSDGLDDFQRDQRVNVKTFFRGCEAALCDAIDGADAVVGCVAWLTSRPVLEALARKHAVSIVVQKEDFLRRDCDSVPAYRQRLRENYEAIKPGFIRDEMTFYRTSIPELSPTLEQSIAAIRCMGVRGVGDRIHPRMHHKFMVLLRLAPEQIPNATYIPYAVWTGSFNPTANGTRSLENAVLITSNWDKALLAELLGKERVREWVQTDIPHAYFQEWAQVLAHSEPLDWASEHVAPEWERCE